ncbi:MAG: hypothetical protein HY644_00710 [Acidobacteria bacterium]|nr:hypothetical protein [Acidobacteriota bacterium]
MKEAQKFILWGTGILLLINFVAIGLSWWHFGYLDWQIAWEMALVMLPPVLVGLGSYFLLGIELGSAQEEPNAQQRQSHYGVPHETPTH